MKNLSVFDMKQQYILKLILLSGITLFSTGIISRIPCFINDLLMYVLLHICPHASVFQKWWQNVSRNLCQWILVPLGGGKGFMCGRHGAGLDWPEEKDNFSNNILLIFAAIKIWAELAMLPIYYGTSFLTFCQIQAWKRHLRRLLSTKLP